MTPKEKAQEMFDKYCSTIGLWMLDSKFSLEYIAKQCAVIAVDEVTEGLSNYGLDSYELQNMDRVLNYWDEVIKEIDKL